ncbi:hypothetical protein Y788_16365 [Pantoea dispersa 625]|nr:hypothetical protein Y788_16365 [Pantoea dispersa 625]
MRRNLALIERQSAGYGSRARSGRWLPPARD